MVYIGCSGFYNPAWKPAFYPEDLPKSKWFEFYAQHFNTVEINNTFYKFPTPKSLASYYNRSPGGFTFSVKVPRLITHFKQLNDCKSLLKDFYTAVADGLNEKAGPVLFQFHSKFFYSKETFDLLLHAVDPSFQNVAEFRHTSWYDEHVMMQLNENKIHISGISHPNFPVIIPSEKELLYFRFHGTPVLYKSSYQKKSLAPVVAAVKAQKSKDVFIYFNNTITIAGVQNAMTFRKMLEDAL